MSGTSVLSTFEAMGGPLCDFCGDGDPVILIPCRDFEVVVEGGPCRLLTRVSGAFAACAACSRLVECEDRDGLLARAIERLRRLGVETSGGAAAMQAGFWSNRQ